MGLPAPPPMEAADASPRTKKGAAAIPDWQKDPHGWLDYDDKADRKARIFCQLQNIQNKPELNGQVGLCVGYHPSVKRYQVQLCRQTNNVVSVAPEKLRMASFWQQLTGKLQLILQQKHQIHQDARVWLKQAVPVGILAGHSGPTDAALDDALFWLLLASVFLILIVVGGLMYWLGFNKACTVIAFGLTVAVVVGPELVALMTKTTDLSSWSQRCTQRWVDFLQDTTGYRPTPTVAISVGVLWCSYVGWICWAIP